MHTHETKNLIAIPEYMVTVCKMIMDFQRGFVFTHPFQTLIKIIFTRAPFTYTFTFRNNYSKQVYQNSVRESEFIRLGKQKSQK